MLCPYWQDNRVASIGLRPACMGRGATRAMFAAAVRQLFHISHGGRGEFQYADDVAKTFIACARPPFEGTEIFNLHGIVDHMRELVAAIEAVAPVSRGQITFAEPGFPSPEEFDAGALIGPLPHTPLREGVVRPLHCFASGSQAATWQRMCCCIERIRTVNVYEEE